MDIVESIKKDKAYNNYKSIVKKWENDFKSKNSRTPSKFDIKEAPSKIKHAYKKYFQLKSAALETSLALCEYDDEPYGSPDCTQQLESMSESLSPRFDCNTQSEQLPKLPSGPELELLLSNVQQKDSIKVVDVVECVETKSSKPPSSFINNFSKKLFENSRFSLRNPRKSFTSKSQSLLEGNLDKQIKVEEPRIEGNVLSLKTTNELPLNVTTEENTNIKSIMPQSIENVRSTPIRTFNSEWLQRANCLHNEDVTKQDSFENSDYVSKKFGLTNINIPLAIEKMNDYIENSESENEHTEIHKLKPALKKRKLNDHNISSKMECSNQKNQSEENNSNYNEKRSPKNIRKNKNVKKPKLKKNTYVKTSSKESERSTDIGTDVQPPDIKEYVPFGLEENIKPRHLKPIDILNNIDTSNTKTCKPKDNHNSDKLENKIQNGTLNDNFVRINIEKKVFVRGKKSINFSKYKKQQWKDKKALHSGMEFPENGKISCFKCGNFGHMARYCTAHKGDTLLPLESYNESDLPTLEDMQNMLTKESNNKSLSEQLSVSLYEASQVPEEFLKLLKQTDTNFDLKPLYSNIDQDTPKEISLALEKFGHNCFRPGQEKAIMRILCGMSTLLVLSTGSGKSLCYQLPAYIYSLNYKCITLVISPLVSLMEDQVLSMPEFLKAGCLHTNQAPTQRHNIIQCLKDGEINILLISPEALISGDGSKGLTGIIKSLPPIAFACIDEAHCVSQWSHNFRPSYLMICRVLREKLNVKCILGLTATASQSTIQSIVTHIGIPDHLEGVITNPTLPDNLCLSVSCEREKDKALVAYLNLERIIDFNSIIVYCIRRDECERVAALLRSCLQIPGKVTMEKQNNKRKRMSYISEAYHAGMSAAQRKKIQKHFMDGSLRIIVATVAFGMGINKSDIRCIIHYNTPSSFESYVQEVGRAGRDGKTAYCHVFMNNSSNDKNELLKHIHANTIDRPTIRKLLQKVFIPCQCGTSQESASTSISNIVRCKGHEVGIPIDSTVEELDVPSENIATLFCYIELHYKQYIKILNNAYTKCKISSYGGPQKILEVAKNCPPLAMAYIIESKRDSEITKKSIFEFNVIEVASAIGWESGMTKYQLKNLEWITEAGTSRRSQLKVEFHTLGFRLKAPGDLSAQELDNVLDDLHKNVLEQERCMLYQLEECYSAFSKLGNYSLEKTYLEESILVGKSNDLKEIIRIYFQRENNLPSELNLTERPLDVEHVKSDVRALISSYKDCTFNGRSIARIFQGISSPNYPALVWGRCKFWRSHMHEDFYGLMKVATQEIIQMKCI